MNKRILVIMTTAILTIGVVTAVYTKDNNSSNFGFGRSMMYQNNINNNDTYNRMIDLMKNNGFEAGAKAMENRDYKAMTNFMNNITDEQYNQMLNVMKNNGYEGMIQNMGSLGKQGMVNVHNSMMGK